MDAHFGEVMNNHRDAVAAHRDHVEEARQKMIDAGARWYVVIAKDRHGESHSLDTLAFSAEEASRDALELATLVEVVEVMTQEEFEAR